MDNDLLDTELEPPWKQGLRTADEAAKLRNVLFHRVINYHGLGRQQDWEDTVFRGNVMFLRLNGNEYPVLSFHGNLFLIRHEIADERYSDALGQLIMMINDHRGLLHALPVEDVLNPVSVESLSSFKSWVYGILSLARRKLDLVRPDGMLLEHDIHGNPDWIYRSLPLLDAITLFTRTFGVDIIHWKGDGKPSIVEMMDFHDLVRVYFNIWRYTKFGRSVIRYNARVLDYLKRCSLRLYTVTAEGIQYWVLKHRFGEWKCLGTLDDLLVRFTPGIDPATVAVYLNYLIDERFRERVPLSKRTVRVRPRVNGAGELLWYYDCPVCGQEHSTRGKVLDGSPVVPDRLSVCYFINTDAKYLVPENDPDELAAEAEEEILAYRVSGL